MDEVKDVVVKREPALGEYITTESGKIFVPFTQKQENITTAHVQYKKADDGYEAQGMFKTFSEDVALSGTSALVLFILLFFLSKMVGNYFTYKRETVKANLDSQREERRQQDLYTLLASKKDKE